MTFFNKKQVISIVIKISDLNHADLNRPTPFTTSAHTDSIHGMPPGTNDERKGLKM